MFFRKFIGECLRYFPRGNQVGSLGRRFGGNLGGNLGGKLWSIFGGNLGGSLGFIRVDINLIVDLSSYAPQFWHPY